MEPARRRVVGLPILLAKLPANDSATSATREKWLLPLFQEFGYGRLLPAKPVEIDGKSYAMLAQLAARADSPGRLQR